MTAPKAEAPIQKQPPHVNRRPTRPILQEASPDDEIPERLKGLLGPRPNYDLVNLDNLKPGDQPMLIRMYRQETNLLNRVAVVWALAAIGDEQVVDLFKYGLTLEYQGRRFDYPSDSRLDQKTGLFALQKAMGLLGTRHQSAFNFIVQGTDPMIWKSIAQWSSGRGAETYGRLASASIQALGMTGRPEALEILNRLSETDLINTTEPNRDRAREFDGALTDAMAKHWAMQSYGYDYVVAHLFGDKREALWETWKASEEGKKWTAWYQARISKTP